MILPLWGHLVVSGDIFYCLELKRMLLTSKDAAKPPTVHKSAPSQKYQCVKVKKPWFKVLWGNKEKPDRDAIEKEKRAACGHIHTPAKVLGVRLYGRNSGILTEYYDIARIQWQRQRPFHILCVLKGPWRFVLKESDMSIPLHVRWDGEGKCHYNSQLTVVKA